MSLYWYAYISMNTYYYMIYNISLKTIWQALSNTSLIMWIHLAVYEILANKSFTVTNCYELMSLGSDNRTALVLSNTRELDRVPSTE